MDLYKVSD